MKEFSGTPWWPSSEDPVLSLPESRVQSLVRKPKSYEPQKEFKPQATE